ncbi:MAG: hypothetical protein ACREDL_09715 [Bradyrhizobium sp.]
MAKIAKSSDKSQLSFLPKTSSKLPKAVQSEVEAYGFIRQQLRDLGWIVKDPSKSGVGQVWTTRRRISVSVIRHFSESEGFSSVAQYAGAIARYGPDLPDNGDHCKFLSISTRKKYFCFTEARIGIWSLHPASVRGTLRDRHERWVRDAVDASTPTDERRFMRTAKACGSGTPWLVSSSRRCSKQSSRATVTKRSWTPGRARHKP